MSEEREEALEDLGTIVDTLENLIAAAAMPLPMSIHYRALTESLPSVRERLKAAYFKLGGEDVWRGWDDEEDEEGWPQPTKE